MSWCRENRYHARLNKTLAQRQEELASARRTLDRQRKESDLKAHITALGLGSVEAYQAWCRENGVGDGRQKSKAQRQQEIRLDHHLRCRKFATRSTASQHKRRRKDTLKRIAAGQADDRELTSPVLLRVQHIFNHALDDSAARAAFLTLLLHVEKHGRLFHLKPAIPQYGPRLENNFVDGMAVLATWHDHWIRRVEDWQPESHNACRQFGALARHLLADYDVPPCMDTSFFTGIDSSARTRQYWFVHVGTGKNIRKADIPLRFTKRMAHEFLFSSPPEYTVDAALRWAQVTGMGGDDLLAEAVCDSKLGDHFEEDSFWETVLHFFVNSPMLDVVHVGPIVDYVHHQRFVRQERRNPDGSVSLVDPPDPEFTMKGRTPESMLRRVDAWHGALSKANTKTPKTWPSTGIQGFECVDEDDRAGEIRNWKIEEILSDRALAEEGKAMRHCVATYKNSCANGHRSIWSMQVGYLSSGNTRRVLTIELINNKRYIRQVRGRSNTRPHDAHSGRAQDGWDVLIRWAKQEGLTLPREGFAVHGQSLGYNKTSDGIGGPRWKRRGMPSLKDWICSRGAPESYRIL